jgi:hypothetical protein
MLNQILILQKIEINNLIIKIPRFSYSVSKFKTFNTKSKKPITKLYANSH